MRRFAFYRFILWNSLWNKDEKCRRACKSLLTSPGAMAAAYEDVLDAHAVASPVTDFLDWLLAHADEILALIVKIMDLFAEDAK